MLPFIPTCEKLEAAAYWKSQRSPPSFFKRSIHFWIRLPSLFLPSDTLNCLISRAQRRLNELHLCHRKQTTEAGRSCSYLLTCCMFIHTVFVQSTTQHHRWVWLERRKWLGRAGPQCVCASLKIPPFNTWWSPGQNNHHRAKNCPPSVYLWALARSPLHFHLSHNRN